MPPAILWLRGVRVIVPLQNEVNAVLFVERRQRGPHPGIVAVLSDRVDVLVLRHDSPVTAWVVSGSPVQVRMMRVGTTLGGAAAPRTLRQRPTAEDRSEVV